MAGAAVVSVILGVSCGFDDAEPIASDQPSSTETACLVNVPAVNRIAYISMAGELFTSDPSGNNAVQLTSALQVGHKPPVGPLGSLVNENELYAWPTWSPDGTKLAATRVLLNEDGVDMTVQVVDVRASTFTTVHRNRVPSLVADSAPHYIYWAPDSRTLSFLAAGDGEVTLYLWDSAVGGDPSPVESDSPLYYHWASDSGSIVLHAGTEVKVRHSPPGRSQTSLLVDANGFRVPAFSPDSSQVAYVRDTAEGGELFVAPTNNLGSTRKVMSVGAVSAFLWSPDGSMLGVADQGTPGTPLFERLLLVPAAGGEPLELANEQLMAFFWSPAGDRIAWAAVDVPQGQMEWVVASVATGQERRLFCFRPTPEVLTMLNFFDQYAYSNYPWSADGASLVVAGTQQGAANRSNGSGPTGSRIYVLDVVGGGDPRQIAAGSVAFWSWN